MSITKFENVEGELISPVDIDAAKLPTASSRCSCIDCDSVGCFEKRTKTVQDHCQCTVCRERRYRSIVPNVDRENKLGVENATKKVIKEVVTKETIESLKRVTETMYEFDTKQSIGTITERQSKHDDNKVMPTTSRCHLNDKLECCCIRSKNDSEATSKRECSKQKPNAKAPSTHLNQSHKDDNTATKLSALVMNVPYEDLHDVPSAHDLTEQNPLSKLNVFKRIKEIYDACSCKVCECISNKPRDFLRDDFCKCTPCQCQDCVKLRRKIEEKIKRIPHAGCPCVSCDRKDCRGITKNTLGIQACDCDAGESLQCPENLERQCKCEPCQCIHCKFLDYRAPKSVKLGHVDEIIQRDTCQCSPCECIECKQIYSRTDPITMFTYSKDMNKFSNYCRCNNCHTERCQIGELGTCNCAKQKAMRKIYNKNYNDYDIRTVIVDNNGPFNQQKECNFEKNNTVAYFASLKNNYPSSSCNTGVCKCSECECIVCSAKTDSLQSHRDNLRHDVMSIHNSDKVPMPLMNACKCMPCECEICSKKGEQENSMAFESKCRCDVCDCLNCDNAPLATSSVPTSSINHYTMNESQTVKPIRNIQMNKNCNCSPCDCRDCKKLFSCSSNVKFYSNGKSVEKITTRRLRKVMLVTPTTSESRLKSRKTYDKSISPTTLSPKQSIEGVFRQDLSTCHAISHKCAPMLRLTSIDNNKMCQLYQDSQNIPVIHNPILDTISIKSMEETPILDYPCEFIEMSADKCKKFNQNNDKLDDIKCKRFNIIHEQLDKIACNVSEESLPDSWSCRNDTSNPGLSRNVKMTCQKTSSNLTADLNDCLNKIKSLENKKDNVIEKPIEIPTNQTFEDKTNTNKHDVISEYIERCYGGNKYNSCDSEYVNFGQVSSKYTDSLNNFVKLDTEAYKRSINSDVNIDYENATRVLWEAKAFSSKLIKMLDSFETANRQFESASQKFKILHESLLDINESELNNNYGANLGTTPRSAFENTFEIIAEVNNDKQIIDEVLKDENKPEREYEQLNKTENIRDNSQFIEEVTPLKPDASKVKHINNITEIINEIELHKNEMISKDGEANDINVMQTRKSQPLFKKTSNQIDILSAIQLPHIKVFLNSCRTEDSNAVTEDENVANTKIQTVASVKKMDLVFDNTRTVNTSVATDDVEVNLVELTKPEVKQPWQIFRKNLYLNDFTTAKKEIFQTPTLESDIKEAIQAISLQTTNERYNKPTHLQSEVNNLLNMPLLQTSSHYTYKTKPDVQSFPRTKLDLELKSMSSTASSQTYDRIVSRADKEVYFNINSEMNNVSCEELKANFIGVRRVSDHTVLVKWTVPKRIKDVEGYELLVDGRAVQKIFSPTRRMAVVTCLPHAARVLLTIRTIASVDCSHTPTSSIVYRPRMK